MKSKQEAIMHYLYMLGLILSLTGCCCTGSPIPQSYGRVEVVDECYVHKYGVEVPANDWQERGREGQVVTTLKNGVVMTHNYVAGVLDGDSTFTFPHSDTIEKTETYSRDDLIAETFFYRSGTPRQKIAYEGSPNRRTVTSWYSNGNLQSTEYFDRNYLIAGDYLNATGQTESKIVDGNGSKSRRDPYGNLESIDSFQNGNLVLSTTYHPNGTPKEMTPYNHGVIDGQVKLFLPSGEPLSIEEWKQGHRTGLTIAFENGEKISETYYTNGLKNGIERHFRDSSVVVEEITWINDIKHGPSTTYVKDYVKTDWYFKGKPVTQIAFERMTAARSF